MVTAMYQADLELRTGGVLVVHSVNSTKSYLQLEDDTGGPFLPHPVPSWVILDTLS